MTYQVSITSGTDRAEQKLRLLNSRRRPRRPGLGSLRRCLSIGSSDSSGGAGIQGDIKTFASLGCYGMTAVVGITAQNTLGIAARQTVEPSLVAAQVHATVRDIGVDAVKVGTAWSPAAVDVIAESLEHLQVPIVLDPVFFTAAKSMLTSGLETVGSVIRSLFPIATIVTPNFQEAQLLTGRDGEMDARVLAEALLERGARAAVVTGGGALRRGDWFFDGGVHEYIATDWHETGAVHGSGCAHSAALTAFLAYGESLIQAARWAHGIAASGVRRGWTTAGSGHGPVDVLNLHALIPAHLRMMLERNLGVGTIEPLPKPPVQE